MSGLTPQVWSFGCWRRGVAGGEGGRLGLAKGGWGVGEGGKLRLRLRDVIVLAATVYQDAH